MSGGIVLNQTTSENESTYSLRVIVMVIGRCVFIVQESKVGNRWHIFKVCSGTDKVVVFTRITAHLLITYCCKFCV